MFLYVYMYRQFYYDIHKPQTLPKYNIYYE